MTTVEKKTQNALPFPEKITEYDQYLFAQATNYDIYNKLGSHVTVNNGEKGGRRGRRCLFCRMGT